jgi:uncharacterized protein YjbI with pentapeptide repeats
MHLVLPSGKVRIFDDELRAQIADEDVRARLRRQLPSNIFVQFLAGPREARHGLLGFMLRQIARISLVLGPIALLVFFQLQFLPYHDSTISWLQRIAVVIDVVLLWMFWPSIVHREPAGFFRGALRCIGVGVASLLPIMLVFAIATFHREWLERRISPTLPHSLDFSHSLSDLVQWIPWEVRRVLVAGDVDLAARRPTSLFSNGLVLPGLDVAGTSPQSVPLRSRNLEGAVLIGASLGRTDFTGADLSGAVLDGADLRKANLGCPRLNIYACSTANMDDCVQLQWASLERAQLEGASLGHANLAEAYLEGANLQRATLDGSVLQWAHLKGVNLRGASLVCAKLQHADLSSSQLQDALRDGADLDEANLGGSQLRGVSLRGLRLQNALLGDADPRGVPLSSAWLAGATLRSAQLQGAALDHADLRGANLEYANLEGASLDGADLRAAALGHADLRGASLQSAQLQASSLRDADLQGAWLDNAQLQGAVIDGADIRGASLRSVFSWRADARKMISVGARVVAPTTGAKRTCDERVCDWSTLTFSDMKRDLKSIPEYGEYYPDALARIAGLDPTTVLKGEGDMASSWLKLAASTPLPGAYESELAERWRETGCAADASPYVIEGLLDRLDRLGSLNGATLAGGFLDEAHCAAVKGLPEAAKAKLKAIRDAVPRPPPGATSQAPNP